MSRNTGGAAFPQKRAYGMGGGGVAEEQYNEGMTLRDYFAGKVLQSYVIREDNLTFPPKVAPEDAIAYWSYQQADAMLRERDK